MVSGGELKEFNFLFLIEFQAEAFSSSDQIDWFYGWIHQLNIISVWMC